MAIVMTTAACGGETGRVPASPPASTEVVRVDVVGTSTPTDTAAVVGPLVVYQDVAVVVFDVGAGKEVRRVALPDGTVSVVLTRERKVAYIVGSGSEVEVHAIDPRTGADDVDARFAAPGEGGSYLLSPDGRYVAFSVPSGGSRSARSTVGVIDLHSTSARVITGFSGEEFRGSPTPAAWRHDGSGFVVQGAGHPGSSLATVMLNGTVRLQRDPPPRRLSPNGRAVMFDDVNTVGCVFAQPQRLRIHDLDTDRDAAVVEDPGRGLVFGEWSPSGDELVYTQYQTKPARPDDCLPEFDPASGRTYVLSALGGSPEAVTDVGALRARWYGGVRIEYACADGAPAGVWGRCQRDERVMLLNGAPLRDDGLRILGVIGADAAAADR